ncbi:DUF664 domain-containing protein [Paenibacillus sp. NPDC057967]|uniref:mycothiol transferase n=1 Tax=Paenibacillus sp. NPDC057967 TaxID=3346293 RepID=UPI0036D9B318
MIHDLQGDAMMSPIVGMLFSAVRENNDRLKGITDGMSQNEVDYRGSDSSSNSTAQLIRHLLCVDLNWTYRIKGQPLPQALMEQYGPMIGENNRLPMISEIPLSTLISQYDHVMQLLHDTCRQLTDSDLDHVVAFGHENEKRATIRWGLWHIADHSRYHQAHINLLRKWYQAGRM